MTLLVRSFVLTADADRAAALGLVAVRRGRVTALASEVPGAPAPTETELRAHADITARVHAAIPSLPARFGTLAADERVLGEALAAREDALVDELARIGARVELAITLSWREPRGRTALTGTSGRAYLESRADRVHEWQEAERVTARLIGELGYERAFTRESICPRDGVAATVAILIPRGEVMRVRQDIASAGDRASEVMVAVYGPLAPYSFAS